MSVIFLSFARSFLAVLLFAARNHEGLKMKDEAKKVDGQLSSRSDLAGRLSICPHFHFY